MKQCINDLLASGDILQCAVKTRGRHWLKAVACFLISLSTNVLQAQDHDTPDVRFVSVQQAAAEVPVTSQCLVDSTVSYTLSSHVNAELTWLLRPGAVVAKGDKVAEQDTWLLSNQQQQVHLAEERLTRQQEHTQGQIARIQTLKAQGHAATTELDDLEHQHRVLGNDIQQQQVRNAQLSEQIQRGVHYARFNAIVTQRFAEPGQYLTLGDPILELVSDDSKEIRCELAAEHVMQVHSESHFSVNLNNQAMTLQVSRVRKWSANGSQSFTAYLRQAPPDLAQAGNKLFDDLVIGSTVSLSFHLPSAGGLLIEHDALLLDNSANLDPAQRHFVIARSHDKSNMRKVPVHVVTSTPEYLVIQGQLNPTDEVAVRGANHLLRNMSVAASTQ